MSPLIFQYCVDQDASPFRQPTLMRIFGIEPVEPFGLARGPGEGDQAQRDGGAAPSRHAPSVILHRSAPPPTLRWGGQGQ